MKTTIKKEYFSRSNNNKNDFNFFVDKFRNGINATNFPQCFFPIISLFAEDCNYNLCKVDTLQGNLFIEGYYRDEINELMLRYKQSGDLIVARIGFINQRKGKMTKLYEMLKTIRDEYSLDKIVVECANTESMQQWCLKNNFMLQFATLNYEEKK